LALPTVQPWGASLLFALREDQEGQMPATTDLQIVQVPIDDLHPDPKNPRKISADELNRLTRSLREFGFLQPVIARHDPLLVRGRASITCRKTFFIDLVAEGDPGLFSKPSGWAPVLLADAVHVPRYSPLFDQSPKLRLTRPNSLCACFTN
jgi:hypothetical protein